MELEEDLDKIRSAGDFNELSLPILISALRQGEVIFSDEEKRNIIGTSKQIDNGAIK
jgi:ribosome assembly protein 3